MADDQKTLEIARYLYDYVRQDMTDKDNQAQTVSRIQVTLNELVDGAAFADWKDPEHIKARLRAYDELAVEDEKQRKPLPVAGYTPQSDARVTLVNEFKADEERLLRKLDALYNVTDERGLRRMTLPGDADPRWLAIARTGFEQAFMALNRAVFQPHRIKLPEDE